MTTVEISENGISAADAYERMAQDQRRADLLRSAPTALKREPRYVWMDLPSDEYPGWKLRVQANYSRRLVADLYSGDALVQRAALKAICREHNDWPAEDGTVLPPPSEDAFWDQIPEELLGVLPTLIRQEAGRLGGSILARLTGS